MEILIVVALFAAAAFGIWKTSRPDPRIGKTNPNPNPFGSTVREEDDGEDRGQEGTKVDV